MLPEFQIGKDRLPRRSTLDHGSNTDEKSSNVAKSRYSRHPRPCVISKMASHHEDKEMPGINSPMDFIILPNRKNDKAESGRTNK